MSNKKSDPTDNGKNRSRERSRSGSRKPRVQRSPSPLSSRNARLKEFQSSRGLALDTGSSSTYTAAPADFLPPSKRTPPYSSMFSAKPSNSGIATAGSHDFSPSSLMKGHTMLDARSQIDSVKPIRWDSATAGPPTAPFPAFASSPAFAGHACAGGGGGPACWYPDLRLKRDKRPPGLSMDVVESADLIDPRAARMQQDVMERVYAGDPFSGKNPVVVPDFNLGDIPEYDDAYAANISAPNLYYLPKTPPKNPEGGRKRTKYTKRKRQTRRKTFRKRK